MWLLGSLFTLGINQTLLIALLPQIAQLFGIDPQGHELGIIALALNVNLISYWIGSGIWGKYIQKLSLTYAYIIASIGYIGCHILFISALFHFEHPLLWLASLSRLGLGLFSSAFMPIGQTYLAHKQPPELNKLSQLSGMATLGRLIGPALVFIPFALPTVLLFTIVPMLISLLLVNILAKNTIKYEGESLKSSASSPTFSSTRSSTCSSTCSSTWSLAKRHYLTLLTAIFTTLLVAIYQLMLIPYLSKLGLNDQEVSHYLASMMVCISVIMAINQLWLIPKCMAYPTFMWHSIIWPLFATAALLAFTQYNLIALLTLSVTFTIALSNLPAWYSKQLLLVDNHPAHTSKLSGLLAQAHSSGHLLGTGCASLILYLQLNIEYLLISGIISLLICAVMLRKKHGSTAENTHCNPI